MAKSRECKMATDNNYNEIMENTDEHINEIEVGNSI